MRSMTSPPTMLAVVVDVLFEERDALEHGYRRLGVGWLARGCVIRPIYRPCLS